MTGFIRFVIASAWSRILALAIAMQVAALATPAFATILPSPPTPARAPVQSQSIEDTRETGADERISRRIRGIFAAVPALENVRVTVREGVVTLGGSVSQDKDIARAEQIASRIVGVVTVENGIERAISVGESVQSLGGFSNSLRNLARMLPLIGAALLVALAIAAIGYMLASLAWFRRRLAPTGFLSDLVASTVRLVFAIAGIVIGLQMVGAGALLGAVLGGAGIVGVALGFAMRDMIENYVASIMLSIRQPFRANDWVLIDQYEGRVIRLTSRATVLMTLDGNHLRVPNGTVFKAVILNYTRNPRRRFDFELGIDASADPNLARRLGVDALASLDFVLGDPAPSARLENVGDSNIVIKFLGWIDQDHTDWYKARSQAIPVVKARLEAAGFALPEPIYRLRFDTDAPLALRNVTETAAPAHAKPTPPPSAAAIATEGEHVAPDDKIGEMIEMERSAHSGEDKDLLDPKRPVE